MFVSSATAYGGGKAIRGGVPICWPQFAGRGEYPKHGFARNSGAWKVLRTSTTPHPCVVLELSDDESTRAVFPFSGWKLQFAVTLDSASSISTSMSVLNAGEADLSFTTALHTYFKVADCSKVTVVGLKDVTYEDSTKGGASSSQEEEALAIKGEVDRVYLNTPSEAYIVDGPRAIRILKMGFNDAVVWNIGETRAPELKDLGAGEWKQYVCFEAAQIGKAVKVAPKTSWMAGQTFTRIDAADVPQSLS